MIEVRYENSKKKKKEKFGLPKRQKAMNIHLIRKILTAQWLKLKEDSNYYK